MSGVALPKLNKPKWMGNGVTDVENECKRETEKEWNVV